VTFASRVRFADQTACETGQLTTFTPFASPDQEMFVIHFFAKSRPLSYFAVWAMTATGCALLADAAQAQTNVAATAGAPTQPQPFQSALDAYRPYTDEPTGDWKKANDEVGRIGGWRAYLREANPPVGSGNATGGQPKADPHPGHSNTPGPAPANGAKP
jgi:hypothetical protein